MQEGVVRQLGGGVGPVREDDLCDGLGGVDALVEGGEGGEVGRGGGVEVEGEGHGVGFREGEGCGLRWV